MNELCFCIFDVNFVVDTSCLAAIFLELCSYVYEEVHCLCGCVILFVGEEGVPEV